MVGVVKDALSVLFKTKERQVIALLLVIIGIFSVTSLVKDAEVEIKEEIVDDQKKAISLMKDVEENTDQIEVLWKTIVRLESKLNKHEEQRKH